MIRFLILVGAVVLVVLWVRRTLRRIVGRSASFQRRPAERCVRLVPFYDAENKKVVMIPEDELEPGMRKVRIPGLDTEAYVATNGRGGKD
jgi:hypothetical protein